MMIMVKANVKYDVKTHSAAYRMSSPYKLYRLLAVVGAVEFIIISFVAVISAFGKHRVSADMVLYLSIFFGIFVGSVLKLLLMNPVRSFKKLSSYWPEFRYEITVGGENIELRSSSQNSKKSGTYSNSRLVSARETMGFFRLDIFEVGSIVFADTDITEGTADELRDFLRGTLGKKYAVKEGWL